MQKSYLMAREIQYNESKKTIMNDNKLIPPYDITDKIKRFVRNEIGGYSDKKYELDRLIHSLKFPYESNVIKEIIYDAFEYLEYNLYDMYIDDTDIDILEILINNHKKIISNNNKELNVYIAIMCGII